VSPLVIHNYAEDRDLDADIDLSAPNSKSAKRNSGAPNNANASGLAENEEVPGIASFAPFAFWPLLRLLRGADEVHFPPDRMM
jgi:hypothetical protein